MEFKGIYTIHIKRYLELKRALGYKLRDAEYVFAQFDRLTLEHQETIIGITRELAEEWCIKRPNESDNTRRVRASYLSLFARYLCDAGFNSYVPEVPKYPESFTPYIFTREEMQNIIIASDSLGYGRKENDTTCEVMPILIRVLYATGMRIGEVLSLRVKDVRVDDKSILVRDTKNGQDRMLPITDSLADTCRRYLAWRKNIICSQELFFVKRNGSGCVRATVYSLFRKILNTVGIPHKGKGSGPRLHDLSYPNKNKIQTLFHSTLPYKV